MSVIAFRVDASPVIGSGHLMRCLTLAAEMKRHDFTCHFIGRAIPQSLTDLITEAGHGFSTLPSAHENQPVSTKEATWLGVPAGLDRQETDVICKSIGASALVVDHYAIDRDWEAPFRANGMPVMVIDDLANRAHDCDLLLDQTFARTAEAYRELVPASAQVLAGTDYALLRPEFAEKRNKSLERRTNPKLVNILVSLGGTDEKNLAGQILAQLIKTDFPTPPKVTMVLGSMSPHFQETNSAAKRAPFPVTVLGHTQNMGDLLVETDLAIGAAGGSAWERCALGVPACIFVLAPNQIPNASALEKAGAAIICHKVADVFSGDLAPTSHNLSRTLAAMSTAAAKIADGLGTARVAAQLAELVKGGDRS